MEQPRAIADFLREFAKSQPAHRVDRVAKYLSRLFDKTMKQMPDETIFVVTGDIPAMWIRDSTWQVLPLLKMNPDAEVAQILGAVSRRQTQFLKIDPYANAFNESASGNCWHKDFADQSPWVFERKFELDSWSTYFELAVSLFEQIGFSEHLDGDFWLVATEILRLCEIEQNHDRNTYRFMRTNAPEADFLSHDGFGAPVGFTGLVWSGFRPSDDRCIYGYHIPANAHLAATLKRLVPIARNHQLDDIAKKADSLSQQIELAVNNAAQANGRHPYEIDGLGHAVYMDDPNVPNLLSLPKLGFCSAEDAVYLATREWLLSREHEYFVDQNGFTGFASEHTPANWIWPISMATIGLTSLNADISQEMIDQLERSDGGTGDMHESFMSTDPAQFTRPWFSWADMTYVDLVVTVNS